MPSKRSKPKLTLRHILETADSAYHGCSDFLIRRSGEGEDVGDGLALFLARELAEVFDPEKDDVANAIEALAVVSYAQVQLRDVALALDSLSRKTLKRRN